MKFLLFYVDSVNIPEDVDTVNVFGYYFFMYHHGDLRDALIAAAAALLNDKRDWSFSLREVARRAGVSHNAPYNHFSSKQDLLAAVAAAGFDQLRGQMEKAAGDTGSSAALRSIGVAYVGFGVKNPALYRLMFGAALAGSEGCLPPVVEKSAAAAKDLLRGVIRHSAQEEAAEPAVLAAWALVHGLTLLLIDGLAGEKPSSVTAPAAESIAGHVTQLLLDGLRPYPQN